MTAPTLKLPSRSRVQAELCRRSLAEFFRHSWPILEPATELKWNWHLDAIADHVQALLEGRIPKRNLIINVPPGSSKSRIVSVCTTAWRWIDYPEWRGIFTSANPRNVIRDSTYCRQLIESAWYQEWFTPSWRFARDQNAKGLYRNTAGGFRQAMGGSATVSGDRANGLFMDDMLDATKGESKAAREEFTNFYDQAFANRVSDMTTSTRCMIAQRLHEVDPPGHLMKSGDWNQLIIRQEFELERENPKDKDSPMVRPKPTALGWEDPRTEPGELMDPVRFPASELAKEKARLGSRGYACTPAETPITMANWSLRPIASIRAGDAIMGFAHDGRWTQYKPAEVKQTFRYSMPVVRVTMASGRSVRCTLDHKWLSRVTREGDRPWYRPAKIGRDLRFAHSIETPSPERLVWLNYLAGLIDGEGSIRRVVSLAQSPTSNPDVWQGMIRCLDALGLRYRIHRYPNHSERGKTKEWGEKGIINVGGALSLYRELLQHVPAFAKADRARALLMRHPRMMGERDRVVSITSEGNEDVFALETTTGNYIAWGYASSNSQHQQRPAPADGAILKRDWFRWYKTPRNAAGDILPPAELVKALGITRVVQAVDTALGEKASNDYTADITGGEAPARFYILDLFKDKVNAPAGKAAIISLQAKWNAQGVIIEGGSSASGKAAAQTIKSETRLPVVEQPVYSDKIVGMNKVAPTVESGVIYLPEDQPWAAELLESLLAFPTGEHDDDCDAFRILLDYCFYGGGGLGMLEHARRMQAAAAAEAVANGTRDPSKPHWARKR